MSVVSDSVRPHRQQPTRLPRPWDSPGKNTGVGCHLPLQCMKAKSESEVAQSCPTSSDPMGCSPLGSSVQGIFQARVLSGVPLPSPRLLSANLFFTWKAFLLRYQQDGTNFAFVFPGSLAMINSRRLILTLFSLFSYYFPVIVS